MARPVAADAEATRARILQAALALVADRGIDGTSIRDVAAGARVSLATVLHYYGSKDGLYEACIDAMYAELEDLRATLFAAMRPGVSMEELVTDTVRAAVRFVRAHRPAHRILLRTVIDEGMRADRRERYLKPFLDDVGSALAPVLGLDPVQVRLTAQSIVHLTVRYMLHSSEELRLLTGENSDARAEAVIEEHIIQVARAMLLTKPAGRRARGAEA
jgi:AcrR family transcriptional regulator